MKKQAGDPGREPANSYRVRPNDLFGNHGLIEEQPMRQEMKVIKYTEPESTVFEGDAVSGVTGRVVVGKQDGANNFCMRVFEVEKEGFTPKHSHDWEHEIFFHQGNGEVLLNGKWEPVSAGSVAFVPGNKEHQIKNKGDGKLVFVCLVPSGAPEM